ncbi:MAG: rod shape-determining protein [Planctomycetaceae bacterium]|jgi:hypothetical protein|nr:rod shape-determining protein [Planctomycetaceae bacterium]
MAKNTIGIDFGTNNTYVTVCGEGKRNPTAMNIDSDDRPSLPTEILYSNRTGLNFPFIGRKAEEEYGQSDRDEIARYQYQYAAIFKPDIARSSDAKQHAVEFLKAVLRNAKEKKLPLNPLEEHVIFGVPCEADENYRTTLRQIAKEAGFGDVDLLEEPTGALLTDFAAGHLDFTKMMQGYLVVDVGGGTTDFTFFQNGGIQGEPWGDMHLGGRLLDDLFYQWWSEQNPDEAQKKEENGEDFFCRTVECRLIKESVSGSLGHPDWEGKKKEGTTIIRGINQSEFLRRARNFTPSASYRREMEKFGVKIPKDASEPAKRLANGLPVDLIAWFEECIREGLRKGIKSDDVKLVSLAGGSSCWFFVRESIKRIWKLTDEQFTRSQRPFAAISEGLAQLPTIKKELAEKQKNIKMQMNEFIDKNIMPEAGKRLEESIGKFINNTVSQLFDARIKPLLLSFRDNGGTVRNLKAEINRAVEEYKPQLEFSAQKTFTESLPPLFSRIQEKMEIWLEGFGLLLSERQNINMQTGQIALSGHQDWNIAGLITYITILITNVVLGLFTGILATGPIGWIIGIILIVAASCAGTMVIEEVPLPSLALKWTLTNAKIEACRASMLNNLLESCSEPYANAMSEIKTATARMIEEKANQLNFVNLR